MWRNSAEILLGVSRISEITKQHAPCSTGTVRELEMEGMVELDEGLSGEKSVTEVVQVVVRQAV